MNRKVLCCLIVLCVCSLTFGRYSITKETYKSKTEQAKQLVINIPEKSTNGTITLYEPDGSIYFQYSGDFIKIQNNGNNGEDIQVSVYLPVDSTCSCFDGEEENTNE